MERGGDNDEIGAFFPGFVEGAMECDERGSGNDVGFLAGGVEGAMNELGERGGGGVEYGYELHVFGRVAVVKREEFGADGRDSRGG